MVTVEEVDDVGAGGGVLLTLTLFLGFWFEVGNFVLGFLFLYKLWSAEDTMT